MDNVKKWKLFPKIKDDFVKKNQEYDSFLLQLLWNRGLREKKEIKEFLEAEYGANFDPFLFLDMDKAIDLIIKHIKSRNKITIYGDYDADGVTSSALLFKILKTLRAQVDVYIPDRVKEGYGLNKKAIDYIAKNKTKLIITVDTGIRAEELIDYVKEKNLDIIITDHHIAPAKKKDLPKVPVINPAVEGEKYPFKYLAGVGVAFKLAQALISKSKLSKLQKEYLEKISLDLVAIGTIADMVPLLGENRILTKSGLLVLNKTKRKGLKELIKISGIKNENSLKAWNIGFQIGPRLNAAGRMDHANTAFEILKTNNKEEAIKLANSLNQKNIKRQETTEEIIAEVEEQVKKQKSKILIGLNKEEGKWSEGVLGLASGRITNKYYRPSLVLTKIGNKYKGSGRSVEQFNLIKAIEQCADLLDKFGGHPQACGLTVLEENIDKFIKKIKKISNQELKKVDLRPLLKIDLNLSLEEINEDLFEKIQKLAPFGQANPEPIFKSRATVMDIETMGEDNQHIKIKLKHQNSPLINALAFNEAEKWKKIKIGDKIEIVYHLDLNEFNGRREIQMKILDLK